jgi:hypothetical protein
MRIKSHPVPVGECNGMPEHTSEISNPARLGNNYLFTPPRHCFSTLNAMFSRMVAKNKYVLRQQQLTSSQKQLPTHER